MLILTASEIAALNEEYLKVNGSIAKRQEAIDAQDEVVQKATDADNAEKKAYDFYSDQIITKYQDEIEQLNGEYEGATVTTAELDSLGQLDASNRMYPPIGTTKPVRIDDFDGTNNITTRNEILGVGSDSRASIQLDIEPYWISKQTELISWLQNGFGGSNPSVNGSMEIQNAITTSTVSITITSSNGTESWNFPIGSTFLARSGSNQVGILVTGIISQENGDPLAGTCSGGVGSDQTSCLMDGGTWTPNPTSPQIVLEIAVLTSGTVSSNSTITTGWSGFTDADRIAKDDTVNNFDYLLNAMVNDLESRIDSRIIKLMNQKNALTTNQDPAVDLSVVTLLDNAMSLLVSWKVNAEISDAELLTLTNEITSRSLEITTRLSSATSSKTPFYDNRYLSAVNIGDTARGTARIKFFRIDSQGVTGDLKVAEEERLQAIADLLTLAGEPIPEV